MLLADSPFGGALRQVWEFFATGGWFMLPLVVCSMVVVSVSIFKLIDLSKKSVLPPQLTEHLTKFRTPASAEELDPLAKSLADDTSPLGRVCNAITHGGHVKKEAAVSSAEAAGREETSRLERGIGWLEVMFTIAPMLGLIGTAFGLVRIFRNLGIQGVTAERSAAIAQGIAEAMNATIFGLAVAVIAYVAWNFFTRRVEVIALRMQSLATDFLNKLYAPLPLPDTTEASTETGAPMPTDEAPEEESAPLMSKSKSPAAA